MSRSAKRSFGLPVARATLAEAVSRRIVLWGLGLSGLFLGLYTLGFTLLYRRATELGDGQAVVQTVAGTLLTVLGLYVVSFLASFLGIVLSVGSVSSEADAGTLQAVLARPLPRWRWLLQRWSATAGLAALYAAAMATVLLLISRVVAGYAAVGPARAALLVAFQAVLLVTLGMLASTRLSTVAGGVALFGAFGLAWLAGIVEFVGDAVGNAAMSQVGVVVSLLVPSDALWRGASYYALQPAFLGVTELQGGLPFAASVPPTAAMLGGAAAYVGVALLLAMRWFGRRDL